MPYDQTNSSSAGAFSAPAANKKGDASVWTRFQTELSDEMTGDFELIPGIVAASVGRTGDELTFPFPEVLDVIKLCSTNLIAVLGPDLFKITSDGLYQTEMLSGYHLEIRKHPQRIEEWPEYVRINNTLAEEFIRQNPAGDDHAYILSTASWREFRKIQEMMAGR